MFNTSIIEVVVGLIFVFSLMAILVTQINGILSTLFKVRAKELKSGLQDLIMDPQIQAKVLAHPLIRVVKETVPTGATLSAQAAENVINSGLNNVEWVESKTFAEALAHVIVVEAEGGLFQPLQTAINALETSPEKSQLRELFGILRKDFSDDGMRQLYEIASQIPDAKHRVPLLNGIRNVEETLESLGLDSTQIAPLLNGVARIDNPHLKSALQTILGTVQTAQEAQLKIESWFNDRMDRVTAAYQRRMQVYSFIIAFSIALFLNVDTMHLGRTLWEDPELRREVTAAATEFEQPAEPASSSIMGSSADTTRKDLERQADAVQQTIQALLELQLPVGWQYTEITDEMISTSQELGLPNPRSNPRNFWIYAHGSIGDLLSAWSQKLLGLIATTIAAAQGAPFWFDLLRKLTGKDK